MSPREVLVKSFNVPERERYQIVREHAPSRMIIEDTDLSIGRRIRTCWSFKSQPALAVGLCSKRFTDRWWRSWRLHAALRQATSSSPSYRTRNEDWSFGFGRSQFLTESFSKGVNSPAAQPSPDRAKLNKCEVVGGELVVAHCALFRPLGQTTVLRTPTWRVAPCAKQAVPVRKITTQ
jgi:hypothetical protein